MVNTGPIELFLITMTAVCGTIGLLLLYLFLGGE